MHCTQNFKTALTDLIRRSLRRSPKDEMHRSALYCIHFFHQSGAAPMNEAQIARIIREAPLDDAARGIIARQFIENLKWVAPISFDGDAFLIACGVEGARQ
jgi:hypothetical protein